MTYGHHENQPERQLPFRLILLFLFLGVVSTDRFTVGTSSIYNMKNLLVSLFVLTLVCLGCVSESIGLEAGHENYRASLEKYSLPTKVFMSNGLEVDWSMGDRIVVFEGSNPGKAYQLVGSATGTSVGEFSLIADMGIDESSEVLDTAIAVYPFDENVSVSSDGNGQYEIGGLSFPMEYTCADPGTISYLPMVALTSVGSRNLSFKNAGSLIKVSLSGEYQVRSISVQGNAEEPLAGEATIIIDSDGLPGVQIASDASKTVTVNYDPAVQLQSNDETEFFIPIPPTKFESGLMLMITDTEGNLFQTEISGEAVVERSSLFEPCLSKEEIKEVCTIESVAECVVSVNESVTPLFSKCSSIEQLASHIEEFKKFKGVVDVWSTNTSLYVLTKSGLTLSWTYTPEDCDGTPSASVSSKVTTVDRLSAESFSYDEHNTSHKYDKVCIVNQQYDDESRWNYLDIYDGLEADFKRYGFENVKRVNGSEVNLDFYINSLTGYDVIFLITHGSFDGTNHWISTGTEVDAKSILDVYSKLVEWNGGVQNLQRMKFYGIRFGSVKVGIPQIPVSYIGISDSFIEERTVGSFDNAIIFNTSCNSLEGNDALAETFLKKNAAVYLGYDNTNEVGKKAGPEFFKNLLKGMTVGEAYESLHPDFKTEHTSKYESHLLVKGDQDVCITHLTPVTLGISKQEGATRLRGTFENVKGNHANCNLSFCYSSSNPNPTAEDKDVQVVTIDDKDAQILNDTEYYVDVTGLNFCERYYYRFFFTNPHSKENIYGEVKAFDQDPVIITDKWVDLGLSVLWASRNLGAESPHHYGSYYAWGEVTTSPRYTWFSYDLSVYVNDENSSYWTGIYIGDDISATSYDAASKNWGDGARMPTYDEIIELLENCTSVTGYYRGTNGKYFIGPNGNSIFLPFAGVFTTKQENYEKSGGYWSSTLYQGNANAWAWTLGISRNYDPDCGMSMRYYGKSIRPVKSK